VNAFATKRAAAEQEKVLKDTKIESKEVSLCS